MQIRDTIQPKPRVKPTVEQLVETIKLIEEKLSIPQMNMNKNFHLKEGYTDCIRILKDRIKNPENKWFLPEKEEDIEVANEIYRQQLKGINLLKTMEGRSIAIMCVDYLNGNCEAKDFLDLPMKMR